MIQIDMEMPKFCWWMDGNDYHKCPMVDDKNGCCLHSNVSYATWEEQHKHCPLHEVTDTDTVSRQAVIDTVRKIILGFFSDEDGVMNDTEKTLLSVNKAVCNGVRELSPSPIRPHGKWLPEYGDVNAKAHYCSVCEFYYTTDPDEMHYCPHCGADMRKDGEADGINNMPTQ